MKEIFQLQFIGGIVPIESFKLYIKRMQNIWNQFNLFAFFYYTRGLHSNIFCYFNLYYMLYKIETQLSVSSASRRLQLMVSKIGILKFKSKQLT